MNLSDQLPVGEVFSCHDPAKGINKDVRVVPVVVPPLQFLKVTIQVLGAHLVEGADNRPLEQAPDPFDRVGVNITDNPLLVGVIDRFVSGVLITNAQVGLEIIGVDGLGFVSHYSLDEAVQGFLSDVGYALNAYLASTLDGSGHPGLAFPASRSNITFLPADQSFVHFHDAKQSRPFKGIVAHGFPDAMAEIPGRAVGHSQGPLKLEGRDAFLGHTHEVDGQEPFAEGQVGIVHDSPGGHGELISASPALPSFLPGKFEYFHVSAACASNPVRPAKFFQGLSAIVIVFKFLHQSNEVNHGSKLLCKKAA